MAQKLINLLIAYARPWNTRKDKSTTMLKNVFGLSYVTLFRAWVLSHFSMLFYRTVIDVTEDSVSEYDDLVKPYEYDMIGSGHVRTKATSSITLLTILFTRNAHPPFLSHLCFWWPVIFLILAKACHSLAQTLMDMEIIDWPYGLEWVIDWPHGNGTINGWPWKCGRFDLFLPSVL